jgi:hypothetical protein
MGPVTAAAMHADDSDERWPDRRQQRTDTARNILVLYPALD